MTGPLLFQERPLQVRAVQWDNQIATAEEIAAWTDAAGWVFQMSRPALWGGYVFELIDPDGVPTDVHANAWIVGFSGGRFQVLGEREFRARFERVMV